MFVRICTFFCSACAERAARAKATAISVRMAARISALPREGAGGLAVGVVRNQHDQTALGVGEGVEEIVAPRLAAERPSPGAVRADGDGRREVGPLGLRVNQRAVLPLCLYGEARPPADDERDGVAIVLMNADDRGLEDRLVRKARRGDADAQQSARVAARRGVERVRPGEALARRGALMRARRDEES